MRKLSLVLVAFLLLIVGKSFANGHKKVNPTEKLNTEIHKMLDSNNFDVNEDLIANVRFTINGAGEIVVLSVATSDKGLEGFVKSRLNYNKVEGAQVGKIYKVPVRIKA